MLINCAAYQNGKKLGDIRKEQIHEYLNRPGCFVWVALREGTPEELAEMQKEFGLHELAVEDASQGHQRPKLEEYGDSLFAVVHTVEVADGELNVGEISIFVGRNYVLSVRNRAREGFSEVRARCEREPHLLKLGAGFVLYALIDTVVDRYFPVLEDLESELEQVERLIFSGAPARENIERLYGLKQKLMELKHAAGPLQETVGKLHGGRVPEVCLGTQEYFRDVYDHLLRINQMIDSLRDMVTTAISVNLSLITMQESETVKRLASYAALVAVPTMIAGIYGMNFKHMPELGWVFGYPMAIALMVAIDGYLFYRFRKAGWL
ncbi:MAG: magnesium and cobalt transport protein CorA [Betaproteobacteria bacterium RIFCSPLOWO2_02_FULL_67_26]|nr:MAG: magnesium and cobalt transport protein CorA [Betaproteobacteria bacterium RIFCSPLOWO2_02_FULL_67_26]